VRHAAAARLFVIGESEVDRSPERKHGESRQRGKRAADADKRVAEPAPAEPKKRAAKKAKKTDE